MAQRFLLLHGTPLSPQVWDAVRDHLTADAVAVDLAELVDSARQGCVQTEVAAAVLAALPDDEMVVVGHSFGGQVAIEVALMAPERLARLVVVCSRHTPFPAFAEGAAAVRAGRPVDVDGGMAGEPEDIVLKDHVLQLLGVAWVATICTAIALA